MNRMEAIIGRMDALEKYYTMDDEPVVNVSLKDAIAIVREELSREDEFNRATQTAFNFVNFYFGIDGRKHRDEYLSGEMVEEGHVTLKRIATALDITLGKLT